ncbi:sensor histidine kinase [Promicromonospora thailandica]|uniref:histidine kinase n=1 Tax=Promicromonospora thailandica TaxID=765201 RepID=A0A9X2GBY7_9MICO|nr:HAMP domain-containing sensor histidine kinase [Promicromonospora thailandica]MCP2266291.1 Signal transduction histidine kinase [Promicromonospora thailandica]BFF19957.1 HAMP domain-containing sensor histidine kinase [Promicromonospora thailandica]
MSLRRPTVRAKVVAVVVAVTAVGLFGAGLLTHAIQTQQIMDDISEDFDQEIRELQRLASDGVDPDTGEPFRGAGRLMSVAMERNVPGSDEMFVSYLDGELQQSNPPTSSRVVAESDVVQDVVDGLTPQSGRTVQREIDTEIGRVWFVVVPVTVPDRQEVGAYVLASALDRALDAEYSVMRTYAIVCSVALVLLGLSAWIVISRLLRPLRQLSATATRVTETDLAQRVPVATEDDLGDLAGAFNTMLDRLSTAIETQRRFLDDAGHELRTPLTVLRGHLEVLDPDDPADVRETRDLLLDETARMGQIVEELVLLARSERSDFVTPAPVDLGRLTDDVHDKARALGARRWVVDARADVEVVADAHRLTQAVLQLADNAVKFTGPDDEVGIGTEVVGRRVRLWVRDTGPGVPPDEAERIFDRFARGGDTGGVPGSGLGLAIVRAIAQGHGGDVAVERPAGGGARFVMTWPATGEAP